MEQLNKDNYRTNHDYMSYSRFCRFLECEASAAANYHTPSTTSQLVGSYVDAYFSEEMEEFKAEHPEIFTRNGELKADFKKAEELIERIKSDEVFMQMLSGEKQAIMSGEIDGIPFKIKMDSYLPDVAIVDLKVMKDFNKVWSDAFGGYTNFAIAYNYDIELAIFQEIVYQNTGKRLKCYLACITKETPSDIGLFEIPQADLDNAMRVVKSNLPRIKAIMNGEIAPHRCETCAYCRETKKATVIDFNYIGANGDALREAGYECVDEKIKKEN
jgi:hypothetical protein